MGKATPIKPLSKSPLVGTSNGKRKSNRAGSSKTKFQARYTVMDLGHLTILTLNTVASREASFDWATATYHLQISSELLTILTLISFLVFAPMYLKLFPSLIFHPAFLVFGGFLSPPIRNSSRLPRSGILFQ